MSHAITVRRPLTATSVIAWASFVLLCNTVGLVSAQMGTDPSLYQELARPSWAPPAWVFAPVWIALYTLMGTATYLVWRKCRGANLHTAMTIFVTQLTLNFLWTPVFFGLQRYGLGAVVLVANLVAVLTMMVVYFQRVRLAGALIIPLVLWVAFASALNLAIWSMNR